MWKSMTRIAEYVVEDGPVVHGDDRCRCVCHKKPGTVHVKPCCRTCSCCRQNIADGKFEAHVTRCILTAGRNP